jgi:hypothetical protein
MSNLNFFIDFVQESKRQYVRSTITDERIKAGLIEFVDVQTDLCKIITKNFEDFSKIYFENTMHRGNICKP